MNPITWTQKISVFSGAAKRYAATHKLIATIAILAVLGGGYWGYKKITAAPTGTRYILGTVASSTIISTVSASGQVSAIDSIDVKAKVSGEITWIGIKEGDSVRAGQAIATIDNTSIKQQIQQAENSLETSKLQYQKDSAQAPIDFQKAQDTLDQDIQALQDDYTTTFNNLSGVYLDLPNVMTGLQNALFGYDMSSNKTQWNIDAMVNLFARSEDKEKVQQFADKAKADYQTARAQYDAALVAYKATPRTASGDTLDQLLAQSSDVAVAVAQAVQSELNFLNTVSDLEQQNNAQTPSYVTSITNSMRTYLSTANSDQSTLLLQKKTNDNAKLTIKTDQQNIELLKVGNDSQGNNPISLQISANSIAASEQTLQNLKDELADYTVVAPFDGIVSAVSANKGDTSSGTIATIVTNQKIAELSVNEVDAAKLKVGQKATLTFDAIDDLTLTGKVAEVDSVGTVSQGVVSYGVKISFDELDSVIKPGMTVNANIITDVAQDVLAVPSSAVKTQGSGSYVQAFVPPLADTGGTTGITTNDMPSQIPVVIGISDDANVEIRSGLMRGQQIVTRVTSVTQTTTGSATTQRGGFGGTGIRL